MAKCIIEIEDIPTVEEGVLAVNTLTTFEPELPMDGQGGLDMEKATEAQKFAVVMLNVAKDRADRTHEDYVVGREHEGAPVERIENPDRGHGLDGGTEDGAPRTC